MRRSQVTVFNITEEPVTVKHAFAPGGRIEVQSGEEVTMPWEVYQAQQRSTRAVLIDSSGPLYDTLKQNWIETHKVAEEVPETTEEPTVDPFAGIAPPVVNTPEVIDDSDDQPSTPVVEPIAPPKPKPPVKRPNKPKRPGSQRKPAVQKPK